MGNILNKAIFESTACLIKGLGIMDDYGNRICSKYYDVNVMSTVAEQRTFEKKLFQKTRRSLAQIVVMEDFTCVYKTNADLYFYVIGLSNENEVLLVSVLDAFYQSVSILLRQRVERRVLLKNIKNVMKIINGISSDGVIRNTDPASILIHTRQNDDDVFLIEQTLVQLLQPSRDQLKCSLLN